MHKIAVNKLKKLAYKYISSLQKCVIITSKYKMLQSLETDIGSNEQQRQTSTTGHLIKLEICTKFNGLSKKALLSQTNKSHDSHFSYHVTFTL